MATTHPNTLLAALILCLQRYLRGAHHWLRRHWLKLAWAAVIALALWVVPLRAMELMQQHQAGPYKACSAVRG